MATFIGTVATASCARRPQGSTDVPLYSATARESEVCERTSASGYSNPEALVREYVERDGKGEFGRSQTIRWLANAHYCPVGLPGWDVVTIVRKAIVDSVITVGSQAYGYVTYDRIGTASSDRFTKVLDLKRVTLRLVRTEKGWWLHSMQEPHFLVATALAWPTLSDSIRGVIYRLPQD